MSTADTTTVVHNTLTVLGALLPVASAVLMTIGGVPVPVTQGLAAAKALLPIADELVLQIGTRKVTLDITGITTAQQVRDILADNEPWPTLSFVSAAPAQG